MTRLDCQPRGSGGNRLSSGPPGLPNETQFLGLPACACDPSSARVVLLPVPLEATVSYGTGTAAGPAAILEASQQVELYDREFDCEAALHYGVHTLEAVSVEEPMEQVLQSISRRVTEIARSGRLLGVLGGEHSLTQAVVAGLAGARPDPVTVVVLDAHADLRDSYEGTRYSHACVARRLLELPSVEQVLQLGVRSVCPEEMEVIRSCGDRVRVWFSEDVHRGGWQQELGRRIQGRSVYLSLDVDGFDPSLVPATGTPEPDGLSWRQGQEILRIVTGQAELAGFDCVELAPVRGLHAADFTVAKLLYRLLNLNFAETIQQAHRRESER